MKSSSSLLTVFAITLGLFSTEGWQSLVAQEAKQRFEVELKQNWTIEVIEGTPQQGIEIGKSVDAIIGREWEAVLGDQFNGKAIYRTKVPAGLPRDRYECWLLEIEAAATHATVRVEGEKVGGHLGGWTPFRIDISRWIRGAAVDQETAIEIEVDERVGHNTQGFLPIVVPHFGGIWKSVRLIGLSKPVYLNDLQVSVGGLAGKDQIALSVPLEGALAQGNNRFEVRWRVQDPADNNPGEWRTAALEKEKDVELEEVSERLIARDVFVPKTVRHWSPEDPFRYDIDIQVVEPASGQVLDSLRTKGAIRSAKTDGRKLLLNGQPIAVRGLLNWGYAPPRLSPATNIQWMRSEISEAKKRGFNLMKFCLWIPPRSYFELADEMGMLTWVEYPTWHPDFSPAKLPSLQKEFREFFHYDRNYASVLVRSLTCETGPSADLGVIKGLYDLTHQEIPGAIVEDDSSWIQWNRVHDFYDDHPYGNNHTWRAKLDELDRFIAEREPKPLLLGEAIAADTWVSSADLDRGGPTSLGSHSMLSAADLPRFIRSIEDDIDPETLQALPQSSRRYAWLMRKFQIETFRDRFPAQGYVVSVIRDFPLASMGLIDRAGEWKWSSDEFSWHQSAMLVLKTPDDRRIISGGETIDMEIAAIGFAAEQQKTVKVSYRWSDVKKEQAWQQGDVELSRDDAGRFVGKVKLSAPGSDTVVKGRMEVRFHNEKQTAVNHWDLWVVPTTPALPFSIYYHSSMMPEQLSLWQLDRSAKPWNDSAPVDAIVLTKRWDRSLWKACQEGARVVMLADNSVGSLALRDQWFLRGGPIGGRNHPFWKFYPKEMLVDVQHFDWSGAVMFDSPLMSEVTPIATLWDNHDLKVFRSHLLAFDCRVKKGRWLGTSLAQAKYELPQTGNLIKRFLQSITDDSVVVKSLSDEMQVAVESGIDSKTVSLAGQKWTFKPDQQDEGVDREWYQRGMDRSDWKPIRIDQHWEAQGYESLDGWGWYFAEVSIPQELLGDSRSDKEKDSSLFIQFTGADDYFELFVDGEKLGSGGDRELKQTAFELRKSFEIPSDAIQDGKLSIAVRILDWQGAGGLFRPIYLGNRPGSTTSPILVQAQ